MTLLRIEVAADSARIDDAARLVQAAPTAINVTRHRGALLEPPGDVLSCDVPREHADALIEQLHAAGMCGEDAGVTILSGMSHVSERADVAEQRAHGASSDAIVWRMLRDTLDEEAGLSGSYLGFMILATLLGAIGIVTNSPILVVGAMVIGPEFGPIAHVCVSLLDRSPRLVLRSTVTLAVGFAVAIIATWAFTVLLRALGIFPTELVFSGLVEAVASPEWISLVIALIAGAAGALALTTVRSGSLIGVLISVTTIPAAADAALLFTYGEHADAFRALLTLAINITGMLLAATLTIAAHRALSARHAVVAPRS